MLEIQPQGEPDFGQSLQTKENRTSTSDQDGVTATNFTLPSERGGGEGEECAHARQRARINMNDNIKDSFFQDTGHQIIKGRDP